MRAKKYILWVLLGGWLLLFQSCVTSRKVNLLQVSSGSIPTYNDTLNHTAYQIKSNDRLDIFVHSLNEDISNYFNPSFVNRAELETSNTSNADLATYLVDEQGEITFPMLGKIAVGGLTTRGVKEKLEADLPQLFSTNATPISVDVRVVRRYFSVISAVNSGRYPMNADKINIYDALAMFGNLDDFSDRSKVTVVRTMSNGQTVLKTFDLRSEDIIHSEFFYIEPDDVIYIPKMKGYSFGLSSVTNTIAITASTISFAGLIYAVIMRIVN